MKSTQDRQRDERERKLAEIRRQLEQGTLTIRQMTPEERSANPPRPRDARPGGWSPAQPPRGRGPRAPTRDAAAAPEDRHVVVCPAMIPIAGLSFDVDLDLSSPRAPAMLVLVAFLLSFAFIRTSARMIRSPRFAWWPGNVETDSGLHIHHLVWGISLLLISGFVAFATGLDTPWMQITAVGFGIGAGLTLDEFALWLHLEDVYWTSEGRASLDAIVLATVFAVVVMLGIRPFGLDDPGDKLLATAWVLVFVGIAAIAFLKGRFVLGIVALHVPFVGLYTAVRLATPASPWAHRRYRGDKLARARHRFRPDRPAARRRDRFLDLIGGSPGRD
jgi:hypothetical protein